MVGIKSYGAYIPRYRINHNTIFAAVGFLGTFPPPGENAVANHDEDTLSMAVAAGVDCLHAIEREKVDGLYLATTSQPYELRQNSALVATALDLQPSIRTADFIGSAKSGTTALLSAFDASKSGGSHNILVCASDCRLSKPGSPQEHLYGDGAAALLVGDEDVFATLEGYYSVTYDFPDRWRAAGEKFEHAWEDRFIRDAGYARVIPEAVSGLLKKYNLNIKDFAKIVFPGLYPREHGAIAKRLGADASQLQDTLVNKVGDTGSASPLMMLVAALEEAKPGDKILIASFGNGSDVLFFEVTEKIKSVGNRRGVTKHLNSKKELTSYEKYLAFRNLAPMDLGMRGEIGIRTPMSALFRERRAVLALCGTRCRKCGTPQYPPQRVCVNPECGAVDQMEWYRFSDKRGVVFTYTGDNLAASIDPPAIYGLVDFDGGGRFWFDFTDCDLDSIKVGMPVEMTFRRRYSDEPSGVHGYSWKATPIRD
ncbi:MAG TPA: hydroxymethylglutaryl-CoA synthase family protein [Dehalococcoidia bacterium]|nr:hydroxymethylglutaryl-CoA synthase family protein [Dehalococcoidia bacterium]